MTDALDAVQDYVAQCLVMIAEGREADLISLNAMAAQAEAKIKAFTAAEREAEQERIRLLSESLIALEQAMTARSSEISGEMQGLMRLKKAGLAYRVASGTPGSGG